MNNTKLPPFIARFLPFLMTGLMLILFVIGLFIFSWILIGAAIIGFALFAIASIRAKFSKKQTHEYHDEPSKGTGRVIEYDENEN